MYYNVWLIGWNQTGGGKLSAVRAVRTARRALSNDPGALREAKRAVDNAADGGRAYIGSTEDYESALRAAHELWEEDCGAEIRETEEPPSPEEQFNSEPEGDLIDADEDVDGEDEYVLSPTAAEPQPERTPSYAACKIALVTLGYVGDPLGTIASLQHQALIFKDTAPYTAALLREAAQVVLDTFQVDAG